MYTSVRKQVITFDNVTGNTATDCNEFLRTMKPEEIISVTPLYNTVLGGVIYIVEYLFECSI